MGKSNNNSRPSPSWKAPDTLLPRVMALVAYNHVPAVRRGRTGVPAGIASTLLLSGAVAFAAAGYFGLFPVSLDVSGALVALVGRIFGTYGILERIVSGLIGLISRQPALLIPAALYAVISLAIAVCGTCGLMYLSTQMITMHTMNPRRRSI